MSRTFHGVPAAPGRGAGRAYLFVRRVSAPETVQPASPEGEWQRLEAAYAAVIAALMSEGVTGEDAASELRAAHLLIVEDSALIDAIRAGIEERGLDTLSAVQAATSTFSATIAALPDPYFAARAADVRDACGRLIAALSGVNPDAELDALPPDTILIADDLTPSQVARLDASRVRGIGLRRGSPLAHAAILASGLGIPMVCSVGDLNMGPGDFCLVDGDAGTLSLLDEPHTSTTDAPTTDAPATDTPATIHQNTNTLARLLGNANSLAELAQLTRAGVGGVGLLRTEFLFPRHSSPPTLAEQTALFADLLRAAPAGIFTVRAFDSGGDKEIPWLTAARYPGIVGRRGVRLLLAEPELLYTQYRALLRALAAAGRADIEPRFLLPMVTDADEVVRVRTLLASVSKDETPAPIALGAMIEAPASLLMASEIARACDFLSIGTNDLAHFLFATDRAHPDPDALANPLHPAVLRAIAHVCQAAQARAIPVSVCGEVAGNPHAAPILMGLGVGELSLRPSSAPLVRAALGEYTLEECRAIAQRALSTES